MEGFFQETHINKFYFQQEIYLGLPPFFMFPFLYNVLFTDFPLLSVTLKMLKEIQATIAYKERHTLHAMLLFAPSSISLWFSDVHKVVVVALVIHMLPSTGTVA